ncbi:MAG: hypothetical protein ACI9DF_003774 [Verrucomicrobiales bacterium]|jgi:hypothetical protein
MINLRPLGFASAAFLVGCRPGIINVGISPRFTSVPGENLRREERNATQ